MYWKFMNKSTLYVYTAFFFLHAGESWAISTSLLLYMGVKILLGLLTNSFVICLRRELQKLFPLSSQDFPVTRIFTHSPLRKGLILEDWVRWEGEGLLVLVTVDGSLQIQNGTWFLCPLVRSTVYNLVWGFCFLCRAHCCITACPLLLVRMKIDKNKWEGRKKSRICGHRRRWRETRWWRKKDSV